MSATISSIGSSIGHIRDVRRTTGSPSPWLSTLTYSSRAVAPMSAVDLDTLAQAARSRNRIEGITGMVIYDEGCFFQWLEGPAEGLARVWQSVSHDARHTDLEVLGNQQTRTRFFGDWDMKLCSRSPRVPSMATTAAVPTAARSALLAVAGSVLIPRLVAKHPAARPALPDVDARAARLARLLIAADPEAAHALIADKLAEVASFALACASLFEPVARSLGDLWLTDDCSEFDITLGLCRLQTSIRSLSAGAARHVVLGSPVVLIAPQPGEMHWLGAALGGEAMWRAGWDVHTEFPPTDDALQALVSETWFDALDLSLSAAFRREHWLPRMTETIARARVASRNPKLIVSAGGRIFSESSGTAVHVGADMNCTTALQCMPAIQQQRGRAGFA